MFTLKKLISNALTGDMYSIKFVIAYHAPMKAYQCVIGWHKHTVKSAS
jgi:hypothetical protein